MLAEKIAYSNDFPINIRIGTVKEDPIHFQPDIELVFVLKGEVRLKNGCFTYLLKQGDIFTNNGNEVHAVYGTENENITALIQFSTKYYSQFFPDLARSCYRSFCPDDFRPEKDRLKHILLTLLLNYLKKSLNYKQECAELGVELIGCLNQYFNLFSFDGSTIINAPNDDPVQIERISRIISRVYADHAKKLSLEGIAEEEHLSVYYLSHLIHDFVGLNFREFLCFARVELSERLLLRPDYKISAIARDVGFSTTAYYEKYFQRWFGMSPEEHREKYISMVKSASRKEKWDDEPVANAIFLVRRLLSGLEARTKNDRKISGLKLDEIIDVRARPVKKVRPEIYLTITLQDYETMKHRLFHKLDMVVPKILYLEQTPDDDPDSLLELKDMLHRYGYVFRERTSVELGGSESYGQDSIAMLPHILTHGILGNSPIRMHFSDPGSDRNLQLQGFSGMHTSCGMPKPSFYACSILSKMHGDLLNWSANHAVIRAGDVYYVAVFNYDDETERICNGMSSLHETEDVVNQFRQKLDINVTLSHLNGKYTVTKYIHTGQDSIFDLLSKMEFPENYTPLSDLGLEYYTAPRMDVFTETVERSLMVNFSLEELGAIIAVIEPH